MFFKMKKVIKEELPLNRVHGNAIREYYAPTLENVGMPPPRNVPDLIILESWLDLKQTQFGDSDPSSQIVYFPAGVTKKDVWLNYRCDCKEDISISKNHYASYPFFLRVCI